MTEDEAENLRRSEQMDEEKERMRADLAAIRRTVITRDEGGEYFPFYDRAGAFHGTEREAWNEFLADCRRADPEGKW